MEAVLLTQHLTYIDVLRMAYDVAATSLDPSTQNGAILVDPARGPILSANNHFALGIERTEERDNDREAKLRNTVHAESGAILHAASAGIRTSGLVLVCPWAACTECAKAIIEARIHEVVVHKELLAMTPVRWSDEVYHGGLMLKEANVKYTVVTGVANKTIMFDGKSVTL